MKAIRCFTITCLALFLAGIFTACNERSEAIQDEVSTLSEPNADRASPVIDKAGADAPDDEADLEATADDSAADEDLASDAAVREGAVNARPRIPDDQSNHPGRFVAPVIARPVSQAARCGVGAGPCVEVALSEGSVPISISNEGAAPIYKTRDISVSTNPGSSSNPIPVYFGFKGGYRLTVRASGGTGSYKWNIVSHVRDSYRWQAEEHPSIHESADPAQVAEGTPGFITPKMENGTPMGFVKFKAVSKWTKNTSWQPVDANGNVLTIPATRDDGKPFQRPYMMDPTSGLIGVMTDEKQFEPLRTAENASMTVSTRFLFGRGSWFPHHDDTDIEEVTITATDEKEVTSKPQTIYFQLFYPPNDTPLATVTKDQDGEEKQRSQIQVSVTYQNPDLYASVMTLFRTNDQPEAFDTELDCFFGRGDPNEDGTLKSCDDKDFSVSVEQILTGAQETLYQKGAAGYASVFPPKSGPSEGIASESVLANTSWRGSDDIASMNKIKKIALLWKGTTGVVYGSASVGASVVSGIFTGGISSVGQFAVSAEKPSADEVIKEIKIVTPYYEAVFNDTTPTLNEDGSDAGPCSLFGGPGKLIGRGYCNLKYDATTFTRRAMPDFTSY
jgi:hypothetical protein